MNKALLALVFLVGVTMPAHGGSVSVIASDDSAPAKEALAGFEETVRHRIVGEDNISGNIDRGLLAKIIEKAKPDLIFAVGASALEAVHRNGTDLPVVYSMVPDASRIIGAGANDVAGVAMQVPLTEVVEVLASFQPPVRRLGVLSSPRLSRKDPTFDSADRSVAAHDVQLIRATASSPREVSGALKSLAGKIDVLWIGSDPSLLAPEVVEYILLWSYENRVPVVGSSEDHTRKGALFSLSSGNGTEMGRRAGELANRILEGEPSLAVGLDAELTVNLKAAQKLGFTIPDGVLERARNLVQAPVYEEGDWWIFRVERKDKPPESYRVTYTNGKFESDDPDFLKVSENRDAISWLPLISVHSEGPKKRWFEFPLIPGKEWSFEYGHTHASQLTMVASDWASTKRAWRLVETSVKGPVRAPVETPAGKFDATEIRRIVEVPGRAAHEDYEFTYFYSPVTKSAVKLLAKGSAYLGVGEWNEFDYTMQLVAYGNRHAPPPRESIARTRAESAVASTPSAHTIQVQAPVYEEGDWWVFRVSIDGVNEQHRLEYKDGKFESDDMTFLNGEAREFLPWATVHLRDAERQWLSFPIAEDRQWNFRYEAASAISSDPTVFNAEAEVVGNEPVSVGTRAGQFMAFEISRLDRANGRKPWGTLTYFYSPEVKSIVKLSGKHYRSTITGGYYKRTYFELELIDYRVKHGTPPHRVGRLSTNK